MFGRGLWESKGKNVLCINQRLSACKTLSAGARVFEPSRRGSPCKKSMAEAEDLQQIPVDHVRIKEGQATMIMQKANEVFYNKVQVLNRDISITMLRLFAERRMRDRTLRAFKREGLTKEQIDERLSDVDWPKMVKDTAEVGGMVILDALAASGLRSIRYYKEVPGIKKIIVNDLDEAAVQQAHRNIALNKIDTSRVLPQQGNAVNVMVQHIQPEQQFDVVDIDPYGSAAPFLDSAVQAVANGGLLCVTCTDLATLNGRNPETCYAKYRAMPTKGKYMHEMASRIVLQSLEAHANRYKRHIIPLLSVGIDFYLRVFVRVFVSAAEAKNACLKSSYIYQSLGCPSFLLQPVGHLHDNKHYNGAIGPTCPPICPETGAPFRIGGPIWSAPMHDMEWVLEALHRAESEEGGGALPTKTRLAGLLTAVSEELPDVPLHYTLSDLTSTLHCNSPRMQEMQAAIINAGYRVSAQHKQPLAIKTDAPPELIWDIMRCWVKKHPVGDRGKKETTAAAKILAKEPQHQADFNLPPILLTPKKKAKRFPPNPEAFWGPKSRAKGKKRKIEGQAEVNGGTPEGPENEGEQQHQGI